MPISDSKGTLVTHSNGIASSSSTTSAASTPQLKKKKLLTSLSNARSSDKNPPNNKETEKKLIRPKPATIDLSQCHNESLDLVRLVISLHPNYLLEAKHKL